MAEQYSLEQFDEAKERFNQARTQLNSGESLASIQEATDIINQARLEMEEQIFLARDEAEPINIKHSELLAQEESARRVSEETKEVLQRCKTARKDFEIENGIATSSFEESQSREFQSIDESYYILKGRRDHIARMIKECQDPADIIAIIKQTNPEALNIQGQFGASLLSFVIYRSMYDVARCLLKCGAKPDNHSLSIAAKRGKIFIELLLEFGADLNGVEKEDPIFFYCRNIECAKIFVENGVAYTVLGWHKCNVLHQIIGTDLDPELLEYYLQKGVNPNHLSFDGESPLDYAEKCNYGRRKKRQQKNIEILKRYGAKTGDEIKAEQEAQKEAEEK